MYDKNEESLDAETRGKLLIMGDWNAVVGKERLASMSATTDQAHEIRQ